MSGMLHWDVRTTVLVLVIVLLFPFALQAELLDRIVSTVNNEVITASELSCTVAINLRIGSSDRDRTALEATTLEGLINRRLLVQEAHRLAFVDVSEQESSAEVEKFAKRFASDKEFSDFLAGLDMTRQELARMLGEQLLVERFVGKKVGLFVRVSREESQRYFDEHPAEFGERSFLDVQKMILTHLTEQKILSLLDQYLAELRGKAEIRIIAR